jgi:hypothetical protein
MAELPIEGKPLGEVTFWWQKPSSTTEDEAIRAVVALYTAPANKRAIVKDLRVHLSKDGGGQNYANDPTFKITLTNSLNAAASMKIYAFVGKSLVMKSESVYGSDGDLPKALYFPNVSGGVLPTLEVNPGETLFVMMDFNWGIVSANTGGLMFNARAHGVEVMLEAA